MREETALVCTYMIRNAEISDLDFIARLERNCFPLHRQSTRKSILHSIQSQKQWVIISEAVDSNNKRSPNGAAVIYIYKRSLRIYSLAVEQKSRRTGIGEELICQIINYADKLQYEQVTLEADTGNSKLVEWYRKQGFVITRYLEDYYMRGESAYRMVRKTTETGLGGERMIIVLDEDDSVLENICDIAVYSARDYLSESRFSRSSRYHVLNLCSSYKTHSMGYYVSLLASARNHRITPSVMTVKDIANQSILQSLLDEIKEYLHDKLKHVNGTCFEITVILGYSVNRSFTALGKKLFSLFELPFFTVVLERNGSWRVRKINILSLNQVMADYPDTLSTALTSYRKRKRYKRTRLRNYQYDLAILIDKNESMPPSNSAALKNFSKAAEKAGFFVEFVTKTAQRRICEFDALFIRETTALNNHTYSMARHAYTEGLVVIDDPWSILLCSNKVYLYERLSNAGICQPKGWLLTRRNCIRTFLERLSYPLVLKLPESSFSMGVFRVNNPLELEKQSKQLFCKSDLIIAQEFLKSEYDWRIGILDNSPLFACKYFMANGHWQIYNWQSKNQSDLSGDHETVPINQVPPHILKAAMKSAALIGNGLYGVDLKDMGHKAYVIEVNDNPNIDAGIEDTILGDALYDRIINSIFNRIESERQQIRYIS